MTPATHISASSGTLSSCSSSTLSTFGPPLMTYTVYTAAAIELQQIRDPDLEVSGQALGRLETMLRMLESEAQQPPGVRRSIDIVRRHLASAAGEEEQEGAEEAVVGGETEQAGQTAWPDWGGYDFTLVGLLPGRSALEFLRHVSGA